MNLAYSQTVTPTNEHTRPSHFSTYRKNNLDRVNEDTDHLISRVEQLLKEKRRKLLRRDAGM